MTPLPRDTTQLGSDATALLLTALAVAAFLAGGPRLLTSLRSQIAAADHAFELSLQAEQPAAPPAPAPPLPRRTEKHHAAPRPAPAQTDPVPVPETVPADATTFAAVETPAAAPETAAPRADLEALYAAQLRADIDRRKHPPDSAQYRLHHPYGEVRVRFAVSRGGEPRGASIEHSSGSALLDQEALQLVSSGHYPPMPAKAFAGETQHVFLVTIEFPPAHLTRNAVVRESGAA
ncbi:MAG: TonB family protein [Gammaproteobacteria bacterium]|nr:TonB family protein [Gammaproteobacteria bacterium]